MPNVYLIYGKSMVKNNICAFHGVISISGIRKYKTMVYGADDEYKSKGIKGQYVILGSYRFSEDSTQAHAGIFKGHLQSNFYLDKSNRVRYDDISMVSDGYTNNQFVGTWTSYKNQLTKRCNWGDFRIPYSGDLDIGAGEFSPGGNDGKYLPYGWQSRVDYFTSDSQSKQAKATEEAKWWK